MAIATGNPAAAAAGARTGTAGVAQRYYRRFTALERVMRAAGVEPPKATPHANRPDYK